MGKRSVLFFAMILITANTAFGGTLPNEKAAKEFTDKIMAKAGAGGLTAAFAMMKPYATISAAEIDNIILQSEQSMDRFGPGYGTPAGFEFIDSRKVGDSLLRLRYIQKNTKRPLLWTFDFYKVKEGWALDAFNWDDAVFKKLFE